MFIRSSPSHSAGRADKGLHNQIKGKRRLADTIKWKWKKNNSIKMKTKKVWCYRFEWDSVYGIEWHCIIEDDVLLLIWLRINQTEDFNTISISLVPLFRIFTGNSLLNWQSRTVSIATTCVDGTLHWMHHW